MAEQHCGQDTHKICVIQARTGYRLPAMTAGYRLPATDYRLPATDHRLPTIGYRP
ncbi:MAG: hypothetical protein KGJ86_04400 [Chloroflexota bacterium]|nr:hypothetical protein [Chloroflexota bacterium]